MFDGRLDDRGRACLAIGVKFVSSFGHAPAIVGPLCDQVDLLPEILAIVAHPQVASLTIAGHPPRIAHADGPGLGRGAGDVQERIVGGD